MVLREIDEFDRVAAVLVEPHAFAASLAKKSTRGVRMLHQHEARSVIGVWDRIEEDERGLYVEGRVMDWSAEARWSSSSAAT